MRIHASLTAADPLHLAETVSRLEAAHVDALHLDIADGRFVPDIAGSAGLAAAVAKASSLPLELHLMVSEPEVQLAAFAPTGARRILVHAETAAYPWRLAALARRLGVEFGLALNPSTPLEALAPAASAGWPVTLLTTEPDGDGEHCLPGMIDRVAAARRLLGDEAVIEADGGLTPQLAALFHEAGASIVVAGRAITGAPDWTAAVTALRWTRAAA